MTNGIPPSCAHYSPSRPAILSLCGRLEKLPLHPGHRQGTIEESKGERRSFYVSEQTEGGAGGHRHGGHELCLLRPQPGPVRRAGAGGHRPEAGRRGGHGLKPRRGLRPFQHEDLRRGLRRLLRRGRGGPLRRGQPEARGVPPGPLKAQRRRVPVHHRARGPLRLRGHLPGGDEPGGHHDPCHLRALGLQPPSGCSAAALPWTPPGCGISWASTSP